MQVQPLLSCKACYCARRYQNMALLPTNSLVAWLQNIDYTQFERVMQSIYMRHQGDVHPLKVLRQSAFA